jgi:general secretion pathway protein J
MRKSRGFTLIELLVAITVMALLALVSWRGLESMVRSQDLNRERGDAMLTLQAALSQWNADLDATTALAQTRPMDWDGRVLRLTRRSTDSALPVVYVVAWTLRADAAVGARWQRWQSPGISTRAEWQQAWDRAGAWGQDVSTGTSSGSELRGAELGLMPVEAWQLYYFRNDSWSPAVGAEVLGTTPLPDGVRLVLSLPPGAALAGLLTRDWIRPTAMVPKS